MTAHFPTPRATGVPIARQASEGAAPRVLAGHPLRFWSLSGEIVWNPGSGGLVFLSIPEARSMQRMALEGACDAIAAAPDMDGREALSLFWEINDAVRGARNWQSCMDPQPSGAAQ